jgi:biopolymer transport protein ExbB/TolQ
MEPLRYLEKLGWKASHKLERLDIVTKYRALTQTHKQHLASYIEMMPQLGLLGTVISLFLSAFVFDFNMQMLGLALTTTMFGLLAAIFARYFLEMKAEKCYHDILEFLQNQKVIDLITSQDVEETPNIETK